MKILSPFCGILLLLTGCAYPLDCKSPMRETGVVEITNISVGFCDMQDKGGTNVCDREITYRTMDNRYLTLGLRRSGAWPPVWKGEKANIHFWLPGKCDGYTEGAIISEVEEAR